MSNLKALTRAQSRRALWESQHPPCVNTYCSGRSHPANVQNKGLCGRCMDTALTLKFMLESGMLRPAEPELTEEESVLASVKDAGLVLPEGVTV